MRFLLLSLEFNAGTFSGNGVYACSQARALTHLGHEVMVVAGAPPGHKAAAAAAEAAEQSGQAPLAQRILHVELPVWGRLDAGCAWREFAEGAGGADVATAVAAFRPHAVLGVDWHSVAAYDRLAGALPGQPPFVYLNYRVYHRTASPEELVVIEGQEARALHLSRCSLVLSRSDADYLRRHFPGATSEQDGAGPLHVLLPALRSDMEALPPAAAAAAAAAAEDEYGREEEEEKAEEKVRVGAAEHFAALGSSASAACGGSACQHVPAGTSTPLQPQPQQGHGKQDAPQEGQQAQQEGFGKMTQGSAQQQRRRRRYLTCCVRLSPEKEPHRFVDLVVELQRRGALQRLGVVPLMAGAGWDSPYGREQRQRLEAEVPQCVIHATFLGPADLAAVYAATLLNVHPPTYDAFGMTVVEAASQGAPSLVQGGGHVGATDLLDAESGEVLLCDMDQPTVQLADKLEAILGDCLALAAVGRRALAKARSWGEHDNAAALVGHVKQALAKLDPAEATDN